MFPQALLGAVAGMASLRLPERPRLAPWLTVVPLGDDRVQLRAADFALTLSEPLLSKAFVHVAPHLDGKRSVQEICEAAAPAYLSGTVEFLLKMLRRGGALHEGMPFAGLDPVSRAKFDGALRLFAHFGGNPEQILARLRESVVVVGGVDAFSRRLVASLEASGIGTVHAVSAEELGSGAGLSAEHRVDLVVAVAGSAGTPFFSAVNAANSRSGRRWLRVALEGRFGVLGPTVVPGQTACFACYLRRRSTHDVIEQVERFREQVTPGGEPHEGSLDALTEVLTGQATLEAARLLGGFAPPATIARFYMFQAGTPAVAGHDLLRVPRCTSCGVRQSPRDPWDSRASYERDCR
jgi:bacteriocin biosynthesis cyclodehydratase domain-containing protein